MFNLQILDVAIGLIFIYLLLSLICSAANEFLELWFKKRASDLERGIRELLVPGSNSGATDDLVQHLYDHALVNGLFRGSYGASGIGKLRGRLSGTKLPAYIPARNFALAIMDLLVKGTTATTPVASGAAGATPATYEVKLATPPPPPARAIDAGTPLNGLRSALATNPLFAPNPIARRALISLIDAAGDDPAKLRANIEDWYNTAMDRVSGFYKRRSQVRLLVLGLFIAFAVNADSVSIVRKLSTDKAVRESIVAAAIDYAKANANTPPAPAVDATKPAQPASSPATSVSPSPAASPAPSTSPSPQATVSGAASTPSPTESPLPGCAKDRTVPQCKYEESLAQLQALSLPIGWDSTGDVQRQWPGWHWKHPGGWWHQLYWHLLGWVLTALAVSLGAPFWFDLLNKFITVRSTVKPKEKSDKD